MRRLTQRSADLLIGLGIFVATLTLLLLLARVTAVSAQEQPAIAAARGIGQWIDRAAREGVAVLGQRDRDAMLGPVRAFAQPQAFVSAMVWQIAAHRHTWIQEAVALRAGSLVLHALGVAMLFFVAARTWGRRVGLLACGLMLFVPRSLQVLVTAGPDGAAIAAWMILAASYLRSLRGGSVLCTLGAGAVFGLCLALSGSTVWLAALLVVHTLWAKRAELRAAAREGAITVPSALLAAMVLGPLVYLLLTPWLWHDTTVRVRQLVTSSIAPTVFPAWFSGKMVGVPPLPRSFAFWSVLLSLPTISVVLTGAGGAALVRRWWTERRSGAQPGESVGALMLMSLAFAVLWPAVCPDTLAAFPPRWTLAMPFLGTFAAIGLDACVKLAFDAAAGRQRLAAGLAAGLIVLCVGVPAFESLRSPSTLAAAVSPLLGGASMLISSRMFAIGDATMVSSFAPSIDQQGRASVTVWAPDVTQDVWEGLRTSGKLKTVVKPAGNARDADMVIVAGGATGDPIVQALLLRNNVAPSLLGVVQRDGAILMALYRVK
jgi:4-amino-4-deoxy-L-arabinose transferase-like glycosyltransferase